MTFDNQIVWITGASSGIGEALAHELAGRGARLVLSSRRREELERVRGELPGEDHLVVPLDLADEASLGAAAGRVLEELGRVDVMVHNGGISQRSLAAETELSVDRRLIEVDYLGVVALTKALLPSMLERGAGRFVVVSSLVAYVATPLRSSYCAAKHALHGFFEALRAETHDQGVRITMVCPGFIRTEVTKNALTADGSPQGTMDRAQAEGMSPEECARKMARAIEKGKAEVLIGGKERFAVYTRRLLPPLYRWAIRKARVT
jgi:dehydrogenase/reductase SDR family member 7B